MSTGISRLIMLGLLRSSILFQRSLRRNVRLPTRASALVHYIHDIRAVMLSNVSLVLSSPYLPLHLLLHLPCTPAPPPTEKTSNSFPIAPDLGDVVLLQVSLQRGQLSCSTPTNDVLLCETRGEDTHHHLEAL